MTPRILLLEDDPAIAGTVSFALQREGFEVEHVLLSGAARQSVAAGVPALAILDVGLPDGSGLDLCREWRQSGAAPLRALPVLMLTARAEELDRVVGLELGADDYMTKPFSPRELVARVNVILRRMNARGSDGRSGTIALAQGSLSVDPEQRIAAFAGNPLRLTAIEFGILRAFLARPTAIFSREQIMTAAYQFNIQVSDRTIDSHIRNIRAKLSAVNCDNVIETIHGVGFKLGRCEPPA